jgi:hypothetical protein
MNNLERTAHILKFQTNFFKAIIGFSLLLLLKKKISYNEAKIHWLALCIPCVN